MMGVVDEVKALVQAYSDLSDRAYRGEGSVKPAAELCIHPYNNFTIGAHTNPQRIEDTTANGDWYAGIFNSYGVRARQVRDIQVMEVAPTFAFAVADWECLDEDGAVVLSFKIGHGVRKTDQGWRQEFAVHDGEFLAAAEKFPDFVETIMSAKAAVNTG